MITTPLSVPIETHPAALLFPMMDAVELEQLAEDINKNGLLEPIVLYEGMVLDGRNRLAACKIAGITPDAIAVHNIDSPVLFIISQNLHRRHLTVTQRATIATDMVPMLQEETKKRQEAQLIQNQHLTPLAN